MVASKMLAGSRDFLQIMMFAPDWTISTVRAMTKAFPGSTSNPVNARLSQQYAFRTALIYGILMNAANYQLSGHSILITKTQQSLILAMAVKCKYLNMQWNFQNGCMIQDRPC